VSKGVNPWCGSRKRKSVAGMPTRTRVFVAHLLLAEVVVIAVGRRGTSSPPIPNPIPRISRLSPSSAIAGEAAQTFIINGTNFLPSSTVTYKGTPQTATFVSSTQLTISLSASDQATAGTYPVVVTNPTPGGGASNSVNLTVSPPRPEIDPAKGFEAAVSYSQSLTQWALLVTRRERTLSARNLILSTSETLGAILLLPFPTQLGLPRGVHVVRHEDCTILSRVPLVSECHRP
jgi:hypothetical protein